MRSSSSLFINELAADAEEEVFRTAVGEVVYYGLIANSFADVLTGVIESRKRQSPLAVRLVLLDSQADDCWEFAYRLREGRAVERRLMEEFLREDALVQSRTIRRLQSLATRVGTLSLQVCFFGSPPLFWAYLVDQERLVVGHLAMRRYSARNLPVSILVRGDRPTRNLFTYYHEAIEAGIGDPT